MIFLKSAGAVIKKFLKATSTHIIGFLKAVGNFMKSTPPRPLLGTVNIGSNGFKNLFFDCTSGFLDPLKVHLHEIFLFSFFALIEHISAK